jgi:hypothetical protein
MGSSMMIRSVDQSKDANRNECNVVACTTSTGQSRVPVHFEWCANQKDLKHAAQLVASN